MKEIYIQRIDRKFFDHQNLENYTTIVQDYIRQTRQGQIKHQDLSQ